MGCKHLMEKIQVIEIKHTFSQGNVVVDALATTTARIKENLGLFLHHQPINEAVCAFKMDQMGIHFPRSILDDNG